MANRIKITAGDVVAYGQLNDTDTAQKIWDALPIQARGNTWGDEIYFSIPVHLGEEEAQAVVDLGDLGYWPPETRSASSSAGRQPVMVTTSVPPVR